MDEKRGIGKDNKIPWHIKEDLVRLRNLTKDHVVILGRKTYDSVVWYYNKSGRQMPGRLYKVITRDKDYQPAKEKTVVAHSFAEAVSFARRPLAKLEEEVFIIGGGQIYQQALPFTDKLYLTIVEGDYNCDTFFPRFSEFKKVIHEESKESEGHRYKFLELERE